MNIDAVFDEYFDIFKYKNYIIDQIVSQNWYEYIVALFN